MRIQSYGLFWRESEIEWNPGKGKKGAFRLLGQIGERKPKLMVAEFRFQQGIYILHDDYGPVYVGLARGTGGGRLAARLKEHRSDWLEDRWDRFSWFGFNPRDADPGPDGVYRVSPPEEAVTETAFTTIGDLEALLINVLDPKLNDRKMSFAGAERWQQVDFWEWNEGGLRERVAS